MAHSWGYNCSEPIRDYRYMKIRVAIRRRRLNEAGLWASRAVLLSVVLTTSVHQAEATTNVVYNTNDIIDEILNDEIPYEILHRL